MRTWYSVTPQSLCKEGIIFPTLQMRKLRFRKSLNWFKIPLLASKGVQLGVKSSSCLTLNIWFLANLLPLGHSSCSPNKGVLRGLVSHRLYKIGDHSFLGGRKFQSTWSAPHSCETRASPILPRTSLGTALFFPRDGAWIQKCELMNKPDVVWTAAVSLDNWMKKGNTERRKNEKKWEKRWVRQE